MRASVENQIQQHQHDQRDTKEPSKDVRHDHSSISVYFDMLVRRYEPSSWRDLSNKRAADTKPRTGKDFAVEKMNDVPLRACGMSLRHVSFTCRGQNFHCGDAKALRVFLRQETVHQMKCGRRNGKVAAPHGSIDTHP
jgi:hypothetical protein